MEKPASGLTQIDRERLLGFASTKIDAAIKRGESSVQINDPDFYLGFEMTDSVRITLSGTLGALGYQVECIPASDGNAKPSYLFIVRW